MKEAGWARRAARAERLAAASLAVAVLAVFLGRIPPASGETPGRLRALAAESARGRSTDEGPGAAKLEKLKAPLAIFRKKTPLAVVDQIEISGIKEPRVATVGPNGLEVILTGGHADGLTGGAILLYSSGGQFMGGMASTGAGGVIELYDAAGNLTFAAP